MVEKERLIEAEQVSKVHLVIQQEVEIKIHGFIYMYIPRQQRERP